MEIGGVERSLNNNKKINTYTIKMFIIDLITI